MRFTKMHGLGNDYLYVYAQEDPADPAALSRRLSHRNFGAGSDGMIWILPSRIADFKMRIFNADGSEAAMCGNGIRCVGKFVYDKGYTKKETVSVETLSGVKLLKLRVEKGLCTGATVDMGQAEVKEDLALSALGQALTLTPVSMGNPHGVILWPDAENAPLTTLGQAIEHHPLFPGGVNVEFVQPLSPTSLRMRVWERGSGMTMACGTGACASVAALVKKGLCPPEEKIEVRLDGGSLFIRVRKDLSVEMTGPAETVYEGEVQC